MKNENYAKANSNLHNNNSNFRSLPEYPFSLNIGNFSEKHNKPFNFWASKNSQSHQKNTKNTNDLKDYFHLANKKEKKYVIIQSDNLNNSFDKCKNLDIIPLQKDILLNQINEVIEEKKKKKLIDKIGSTNNITTFKKIPRNPFKNTQITSIKNKVFDNANKNEKNNTDKEIKNNYLTHEYIPIARSVCEFAYHENINSPNRKSMEDFHKIIDRFLGESDQGYFSILDGHGGAEPVKYAKDRLPEIFGKFLYETNFNIEQALIFSFQKIDDELKCFSIAENCGSTVSIVYISIENNKKVIYSANVGDSKIIIIFNDGTYKQISTDHKCANEDEAQRIRNSGGLVFGGRMFGQLALSRAIGDFSMKSNGLISTPSIYKHFISDKDKFIILASDGVWDALKGEDIAQICLDEKNELNCDVIGNKIVNEAINRGSNDNISCITIKIG